MTLDNNQVAKQRLAQLVKELRGQSTQREFARLLGTSYTAIQDWEKQVRLPRGANLQRIAEMKGWSQEEIMRFLFFPSEQSETVLPNDPLDTILSLLENLSPLQLQKLGDALRARMGSLQPVLEQTMNCELSEQQKHHLHLLLRASLKNQSPTEAVTRAGIDPVVFTDVFLRDDTNRVIDYQTLEQFSSLCCRLLHWKQGQLPEVDCDRTYQGETALLFKDLAECCNLLKDEH